MVTKREKEARIEVARDLKSIQDEALETWITQSLPDEWDGLLTRIPIDKTEVTLNLDEDMVKWFKRQASGNGLNWLINRVLRVYWQGIQTGLVRGHMAEIHINPRRDRYLEALFVHRLGELRKSGMSKQDQTLAETALKELRRVHTKADPLRELAEARTQMEPGSEISG